MLVCNKFIHLLFICLVILCEVNRDNIVWRVTGRPEKQLNLWTLLCRGHLFATHALKRKGKVRLSSCSKSYSHISATWSLFAPWSFLCPQQSITNLILSILNFSWSHPIFILTSAALIQVPLITSAILPPDLFSGSVLLQSQISSQFPEVIISKHKFDRVILHLKSFEQLSLPIRIHISPHSSWFLRILTF